MPNRVQPKIWIVPLAIAGVVAAFGWWGNVRLREMIEAQLRAELSVALDANVTALEIWTTNQTKLASALADEPKARELSLRILDELVKIEGSPKRLPDLVEMEEIGSHLAPRLGKVGYQLAHLVSTNYTVFTVSNRPGQGRRPRLGFPVAEDHLAKFAELFATDQPVIITPFKPRVPPNRPPPDRPRLGSTNAQRLLSGEIPPRPLLTNGAEFPDRPPRFPGPRRNPNGDVTVMQVATPIHDDQGVVRGALALIINPDAEFSRILTVARPGKSGESYAFDQHGLMISRSRFDEQLKKLGLLEDREGASSALSLRLSDPGGDLSAGFKPVESDSAARPLTHIIAGAVAGGSGVEVRPTRDYRGVPVVGAWRWLPQLGFGVATQIDAQEAYQSLKVLQLLFVILFLLLVLCANGMYFLSYFNLIWRRRLTEANLKMKQLGQYTLEEKIGEGGMGVVYRARHGLMRRDTAVKLLLPDRADAASIQRFEREVCLTCQLTHPNTIQVYDYGHTPEGIFYYAMELLRGLNLHDLVGQFGPQPEARVVHILTQVCEALAEAHALGLVHRDIKPANVFLCNRGGVADCVKVLDFGLVREYREGNGTPLNSTIGDRGMAGTPSFMPPESMKNSSLSDPRSDLYSVGALGYYLVTGHSVFNADSLIDLYHQHLTNAPVPPSKRTTNPISDPLEALLLRCLANEPARRPQSAGELRALLLRTPHASEWTPESRATWWALNGPAIQARSASAKTPVADRTVETPRTGPRVTAE